MNEKNIFLALFPNIKYWKSLPALISFVSFFAGIMFASKLIDTIHIIPKFTLTYYWLSAILLLSGTFLTNKIKIRNIVFFIAGILILTAHRTEEQGVYNSLNLNKIDTSAYSNELHNFKLKGIVKSFPLLYNCNYRYLLKPKDSNIGNIKNKIFICITNKAPMRGDFIEIEGKLKIPIKKHLKYGFNERKYLLSHGIYGKIYGKITKVSNSNNLWIKEFNFLHAKVLNLTDCVKSLESQSIIKAIFLGEKNSLPSILKENYRNAGIYHLLAISGLHVAILISSVFFILSLLPISKKYRIIITLFFIWEYLFLVGFIPSLFRAVIMGTVILISIGLQRKNHALNSLGFAGIIWLFISPRSLFSADFQLSFTATAGILIIVPFLNNLFISDSSSKSITEFIKKIILVSVFVTLSAFISTLPIIAYHFGSIALFGLLANLIAPFLMGIAMNILFLAFIINLIVPKLSCFIINQTGLIIDILTKIANLSQFVPWLNIHVYKPNILFVFLYYLVLILFVSVNKKYLKEFSKWVFSILVLLIPIFLIFTQITEFSKIELNSKNESISAIILPNKKIWIVATPKSKKLSNYSTVTPWLRTIRGAKTEGLILTKLGSNPILLIESILDGQKIKYLILPPQISNKLAQEDIVEYAKNNSINLQIADAKIIFSPTDNIKCVVSPNKNFSLLNVKFNNLKKSFEF